VAARYSKVDRDLLNALARLNQTLGRMGMPLLCTVDEARDLTDGQIREIVAATRDRITTLRRALKGIV
jgi:hypothetical protein